MFSFGYLQGTLKEQLSGTALQKKWHNLLLSVNNSVLNYQTQPPKVVPCQPSKTDEQHKNIRWFRYVSYVGKCSILWAKMKS